MERVFLFSHLLGELTESFFEEVMTRSLCPSIPTPNREAGKEKVVQREARRGSKAQGSARGALAAVNQLARLGGNILGCK